MHAVSGFSTNIETKTLENDNFREVLYTAPHSQSYLGPARRQLESPLVESEIGKH